MLEGLCSPGSNEKQDKDIQSGDRVTQGLSAVCNFIMLKAFKSNQISGDCFADTHVGVYAFPKLARNKSILGEVGLTLNGVNF
ncbi:unnamed protein product [Urochloa humidicola]